MKQTYFKEPKYSKNYIIQNPRNLYEQYVNAFAFSEMVKSHNKSPNKMILQQQAQDSWRQVKTEDESIIQTRIFELLRTPIKSYPFTFVSQEEPAREPPKPPPVPLDIHSEPSDSIQLSSNASAQRQLLENVQKTKADLYEYNNLLQVASSPELRTHFTLKIKNLEEIIATKENRLKRLRSNAAAQQRARKKKMEKVEMENVVEVYDTPGRPSFLINDPNILEKMHNSIEFGAADYKRRKEIIKVRTVKHLREKLEENYNVYMARSTLQNYMQPNHQGTKEAQRHHHPAQIRLASVGRNEMASHVDEHYCLASVKSVKSFALVFPKDVVL